MLVIPPVFKPLTCFQNITMFWLQNGLLAITQAYRTFQGFNLGVRRLQLASTWRVPVPAIPLPVLLNPRVRADPVAAVPRPRRSFLTAAAGWQPYLPHASPALSTLVGAVFNSRRAAIFALGGARVARGPGSVILGDSDDSLRAC